MTDAAPDDFAAMLNQLRGGWATAMGIVILQATRDLVVAELEIGPVHHQPYGIVHGGVHAGVLIAVRFPRGVGAQPCC